MLYIKVSIPILLFKTFIYSYNNSDKNIFIGQGVVVNFNNREVSGYITDISKKTNYTSKINPLLSLNKNSVIISNELIQTINWISHYYICPLGKTLKATIPYQLYTSKIIREKYIKITSQGLKKTDDIKFIKQKMVLKYLSKYNNYIKINSLKNISASYNKISYTLFDKGFVKIIDDDYNNSTKKYLTKIKNITLNNEQSDIYNNIKTKIKNKNKKIILSGVPGSGKTEIYINVINDIINKGQQAIVLVPEISLIEQTFLRLQNIFGDYVESWHSRLSKNKKSVIINNIKHNNIKIIVGARSCLFMPFKNLGIVIVDEEQENSYKQTGLSPYYHARDVAIIRSKFSDSIILLCSATLSIESFYNIKYNNFQYYYIKKRYNDSKMPAISLVNMEREIHKNKVPILSKILIEKIKETLANNEQIILLQNRRSHSYIVKCINCHDTNQCLNCNVSLKYHKDNNTLQCHHCDYKKAFKKYCSLCKKKSIKLYGVGTQKIEEILKKFFPKSKILRYDRDTINKKDNYLKILHQFEKQEANILLGTQMIAKGLDFKNVSLVGIINADLGMLLPDFRAGEKAFQLIYQLIGRSGRHKKNSTAIIQSYNINDNYIKYACTNELDRFYKFALNEREELYYPPFSRLIKINITGNNKSIISKKIKLIYEQLSLYDNMILLGPTECPIEKINNLFRMHLILKTKKNEWLKLYKYIINKIGLSEFEKSSKNLKITIDVDPISFL